MLRIRLRRMGNRNRPFYRVVVSDSRRVPTSSAIEEIGFYDPRSASEPVKIDAQRAAHWIGKGAQPTPTVKKLLGKQAEAPVSA